METMDTLSLKIESLEKGQIRQETINNDIFVRLENRVTYKMFFWILGVLLVILIALFSWIAVELDNIQSSSDQVKNQVSYIDGVFKENNLQFNP